MMHTFICVVWWRRAMRANSGTPLWELAEMVQKEQNEQAGRERTSLPRFFVWQRNDTWHMTGAPRFRFNRISFTNLSTTAVPSAIRLVGDSVPSPFASLVRR